MTNRYISEELKKGRFTRAVNFDLLIIKYRLHLEKRTRLTRSMFRDSKEFEGFTAGEIDEFDTHEYPCEYFKKCINNISLDNKTGQFLLIYYQELAKKLLEWNKQYNSKKIIITAIVLQMAINDKIKQHEENSAQQGQN